MIEYIKLGDKYYYYDSVFNWLTLIYDNDNIINESNVIHLDRNIPYGTYVKYAFTYHIMGISKKYYYCIIASNEHYSYNMGSGLRNFIRRIDREDISEEDITWDYTIDNLNYIDTLCD